MSNNSWQSVTYGSRPDPYAYNLSYNVQPTLIEYTVGISLLDLENKSVVKHTREAKLANFLIAEPVKKYMKGIFTFATSIPIMYALGQSSPEIMQAANSVIGADVLQSAIGNSAMVVFGSLYASDRLNRLRELWFEKGDHGRQIVMTLTGLDKVMGYAGNVKENIAGLMASIKSYTLEQKQALMISFQLAVEYMKHSYNDFTEAGRGVARSAINFFVKVGLFIKDQVSLDVQKKASSPMLDSMHASTIGKAAASLSGEVVESKVVQKHKKRDLGTDDLVMA